MKGILEFGAVAVVAVLLYLLWQKNSAGGILVPRPVVLSQTQTIPPPWQTSPVPPAWWGRYSFGNGITAPIGPVVLDTNAANAQ